MMAWQKKGLVFKPSGQQPWARSHCHVPTAEIIQDAVIRVYFASLDRDKFGRIGYVDLDIDDPLRVLCVGLIPVLDLGEIGAFDDCGVVPSCLISWNNQKRLYYIGFQRTQRVPYMLFSGMAIQTASGSFARFAATPILDRTPSEPFSRSAPFIRAEGKLLRMWYWSCLRWIETPGGVHYHNVIRHASSPDGIVWQADEDICIEPNLPDEYSIGRPSVIWDGFRYRMWYSVRSFSRGYSLGYAESADGLRWEKKEEPAGITKSEDGWDSEMICYPFVLEVKGRLHMFYNGNQHGSTGFGLAIEGP